MLLSEIIASLYSPYSSNVYLVLNKSVYVTDFRKTDSTLLFHTGFRFNTHRGKEMDIYVDLESNTIIRHPVGSNSNKCPHLIGVLCSIGDNGYIYHLYNNIITSVINMGIDNSEEEVVIVDIKDISSLMSTTNKIKEVSLIDDDDKEIIHTIFKIVIKDKITDIPLQKTFNEEVFYNTSRFSKYEPQNYKPDRIMSKEEWLEDEFGDDADTAFWNMD